MIREWPEAIESMGRAERLALDLETGGIDPHSSPIAVVSLYDGEHTAVIHDPEGIPEYALEWLKTKEWTTQNGTQFDNIFLMRDMKDPTFIPKAYDTRVAESLLDHKVRAPKFNLRALMKRHLGVDLKGEVDHGRWMSPEPLSEQQLSYCVHDVKALPLIRARQEKAATRVGWPYRGLARASMDMEYEDDSSVDYPVSAYIGDPVDQSRTLRIEQELAPRVSRMELNGMPIDLGVLGEVAEALEARIAKLRGIFPSDLNVNSPKQVREFIHAMGFPQIDRTDLQQILRIKTQWSLALLELKQLVKRRGMFSPEWVRKHVQSDGRIHPTFSQLGTVTSRFSSQDPNAQQIPKTMKRLIQLADHDIVELDFSQHELRMAVIACQDWDLLHALQTLDFHSENVRTIFPTKWQDWDEKTFRDIRSFAKGMTFGWLFAGGPMSAVHAANEILGRLGDETSDSERQVRVAFKALAERYPGVARTHKYMKAKEDQYKRSGAMVLQYLPGGYRRVYLPGSVKQTTLVNSAIQAAAALLMKAVIAVLPPKICQYLVATIHDSILFCVPRGLGEGLAAEVELLAIEVATEVFGPDVPFPLDVKVGEHWDK